MACGTMFGVGVLGSKADSCFDCFKKCVYDMRVILICCHDVWCCFRGFKNPGCSFISQTSFEINFFKRCLILLTACSKKTKAVFCFFSWYVVSCFGNVFVNGTNNNVFDYAWLSYNFLVLATCCRARRQTLENCFAAYGQPDWQITWRLRPK